MKRGLLVLVGLAATLSVSASLPTTPALAQSGSCGGRLVELFPMVVDKQRVGELQLYYNSSNGMNCAIFAHGGPMWGVRTQTSVSLQLQKPHSGSVQDEDPYKYMAGPVRIYGRNRCVRATGGMVYRGVYRNLVSSARCG